MVEPLTGEALEHAFYESEFMLTPANFWKAMAESAGVEPNERFMLRHEPTLDPEDIRAAATAAGIDFTIHQKLAAAKPKKEGDRTSLSMTVSAGDAGYLKGSLQLTMREMLTGDAFCIGSVEAALCPA